MRSFTTIIKEAGTPEHVADRRGVSVHTVRSWIQRDTVPPEHWGGFVADKFATFDELAEYAASCKSRKPSERQAA